ncbi:MAG: zinc ABC transporter substrate-binding protein [Lachnospiraceae bacterium]|nr:zinc ABC transporter substrate-binding protein [Lachnospiraceae bacterium]
MKYLRSNRAVMAACLAVMLLAGLLSGCAGRGGGTGAEAGASGEYAGATASTKERMASAGPPDRDQNTSEDRLQVVTTIFPQYDFARQIAGDSADVRMLLKPGEEIHSYEPTPQDIRMIQNCDLFIYTGGENDVWVENILASVSGPRAVRLLDLVDTYAEEELEGMMPEKGHDHGDHDADAAEDGHDHGDHESGAADEDHDHGDHASVDEDHDADSGTHAHVHEEEPDEHVWTSPANCVILIEKLTEVFCQEDPARAAVYRRNGDAYRAAFEELDGEYLSMAASAARKTILFGDRFPFRYLAEELGLTCYAAFSGCSAESEPSAATIAFLIDKAADEKLPVVFRIEFSNGNIARAVSEAAQVRIKGQTGRIRVLQLHSCHNVTRDEYSSGATCLSLMRGNLEALRQALN